MSSSQKDSPSRALQTFQRVGVWLFALSFFVPAARVHDTDSFMKLPYGGFSLGIFCAGGWILSVGGLLIGLLGIFDRGGVWMYFTTVVSAISGCINVLVPLYLLVPKPRFRRRIARFALVPLMITIPALLCSDAIPIWGCFMWLASVPLIMWPEFRHLRSPDFEDDEDAKKEELVLVSLNLADGTVRDSHFLHNGD